MKSLQKLVGLACLSTLAACVGNLNQGNTGANGAATASGVQPRPGCLDDDFALKVWAPVLAQECMACHREHGLAQASGARFVLTDTTNPDYMAQNLKAVQDEVARSPSVDQALLLQKPTGQVAHGGGKIFDTSSPEYQALSDFLHTTDTKTCISPLDTSALTDAALISPAAALRQMSVQLIGRIPSASELQLVQNGNMDAALDSVLHDQAFGNYALTKYNDDLLTDQYLNTLVGFQQYEIAGYKVNQACVGADLSCMVPLNDAYARVPLQLVRSVVNGDRPFSEVLTASYAMINPNIALGYPPLKGTFPAFAAGATQDTWVQSTGFSMFSPQSGVLGNMAVLNAVNTTATNMNRHRASLFYSVFLNTDIPGLPAQLPANLGTVGVSTAATRNNPGCAVCHVQLDTMGGIFQNWDGQGVYTAPGKHDWPTDGFKPGFETTAISDSDLSSNSVAWLGKQMAADPRFGMSIATHWFTQLTGEKPLSDPLATDPNYMEDLQAKLYQNAFLAQVAADFQAHNQNLKTVVKDIVQSAYYRLPAASALPHGASFAHALRRGPEDMGRALLALTSVNWTPMSSTYKVAFGGIDSQNATVRNYDVNGVVANVADIMAVTGACQSVARDLSAPVAQRSLFPYVEVSTTDATAVRKNIQFLHQYLLNQPATDTDTDELYQLFQQVVAAKDATLANDCQNGSITSDPNFTVKAWMAVMDTLLGDYAFLYE